jgi:hypothetical protein
MKNFRILFSILLFSCLSCGISQSQTLFGVSQKINDNWLFQLGDPARAYLPEFDAKAWRTLDLPHDWSVEAPLSPDNPSSSGFLPGGIGWYRKDLSIPASKKGEKVFVYFEGVYHNSEVFINGISVGKRPSGWLSFAYDLTPYINYGGENLIAVRVDHTADADQRFYTGSGIYRNVYLVYSNPIHIDLWGVAYQTPKASAQEASVAVQVTIKNETAVNSSLTAKVEILSADNKLVQGKTSTLSLRSFSKGEVAFDLTVSRPTLWDLENPYLYKLKTTILKNGKVIDESIANIGIRTIAYDANKGFVLNDKTIKLKGICIHHDGGVLGAAVPIEVWERRFENLKLVGVNAIRMAHNPHAPEVYDLIDRMGFLVMDEVYDEWEFAKKKWIQGRNNGLPGFEGTSTFFNEWSDRDVRDWVLRDRLHPSIIMWSIGNEIDFPNDPYSHPVIEGTGINQSPGTSGFLKDNPRAERMSIISHRLAKIVKTYDKSNRAVTAALAGVLMSNVTAFPDALDMVGYNYTENMYESDHQKYPSRIIYGSENGQGYDAWKAVRDHEFISGQFLWTGIDFLGECGRWPIRGSSSGFLDLTGNFKARAYQRQSWWANQPVVYIGTQLPLPAGGNRRFFSEVLSSWNYNQGDKVNVVCYTNCEEAKLLLNGSEIGGVKKFDDTSGQISWEIEYQPGKLEAIGLNDGKEAVRYAIQTSGKPYYIKATSDKFSLKKDKGLAQIQVQILDEKGVPVPLADDEITCVVEGPAKLLGLESANQRDMTDHLDNLQRVYQGKLLAYVQSTGTAGEVKVTFTSKWLQASTVTITVD